MTDEKKMKRVQNAEILMWLAFICCGMMIAFVEENQFFIHLPKQETHDRVSSLITYPGFTVALWTCFPPLHRRMLQNSVEPLIDVCKRSVAAFVLVAFLKGAFFS